ncbi:glucokinase [Dokdonella soli]
MHGARLIAADVGGTHARVALVNAAPGCAPVLERVNKYTCMDFPDLAAVLRAFMQAAGVHDTAHAAIAIAGYVDGDNLINTNLPWQVSLARTREATGLRNLVLINDFEALACAIPHVDPAAAVLLAGTPAMRGDGATLVLGPGTGFGAALCLPGTPSRVLATEAGHASLAPGNECEIEVLRWLLQRGSHVDNEAILSGPGLVNAYAALCDLRGAAPAMNQPSHIAAAALQGDDRLAVQALSMFCALLGSLAGDLVLSLGASEVYIAGGIPSQIMPFLTRSNFVARFLNKGRMRTVLDRVPVWVIEHGQLGVIGAASWYADHCLRV